MLVCSAHVLLATEDGAFRSCQYTGLPDLNRPSVSYHTNSDVLKGMYCLNFHLSCVKFIVAAFCSLCRKWSVSLIALIKKLISFVLKTVSVNVFFVLIYSRNGKTSEKLLSCIKTYCVLCMIVVCFKIDLN